jgi:hypothetical protein
MSTGLGVTEDEVGAWLNDRWRLPAEIPLVERVPEPAPGQVIVRHHCAERVVGRLSPAAGTVTGIVQLPDAPGGRTGRSLPDTVGRWLALRSGTLATWVDGERRYVQHRRRRVALAPGTACRASGFWAWRTLTCGESTLRMIDAPRRWEGPLLLRLFDFTMIMPGDFDLIEWIVWRMASDDPLRGS